MVLKEVVQDMICNAVLLPRVRARLSKQKVFEIILAYAKSVGYSGAASSQAMSLYIGTYFPSVLNNGRRYYQCVPNPAHWQEETPLTRKDLYFIKGAKKWS